MSVRPADANGRGVGMPDRAAFAQHVRCVIAAAQQANLCYASEQQAQQGQQAQFHHSAVDGARGSASPSDDETFELRLLGTYKTLRDAADQTIASFFNDDPDALQHTIVLVDGGNILFSPQYGTLRLGSVETRATVERAAQCMPSEGARIFLVWTRELWQAKGFDEQDSVDAQLQALMAFFKSLRAPGLSIVVMLITYLPEDLHRERIGKSNSKRTCRLNGMDTPKHLACEMDDALVSMLSCAFFKYKHPHKVLSNDSRVLKSNSELVELEGWIEQSKMPFYVETFEVTSTRPAP